MKDYEQNAKKWILENIHTLNALWEHRESAISFENAFRFDKRVYIAYGMTRIVIVGEDFVIKINKSKTKRWEMFGNSRDEVRMYKKAVKDGYDWLFCRIRAMIIEHHTYYIMEKVDATAEDEGYSGNISEEFEEYLGEEAIDYINENVFDIHNENFGFIDDEPKIFDYAANYC